jgi:hypothetical protein
VGCLKGLTSVLTWPPAALSQGCSKITEAEAVVSVDVVPRCLCVRVCVACELGKRTDVGNRVTGFADMCDGVICASGLHSWLAYQAQLVPMIGPAVPVWVSAFICMVSAWVATGNVAGVCTSHCGMLLAICRSSSSSYHSFSFWAVAAEKLKS